MINVKKGPAHSLGQADVRGKWDGSTVFVAGMVAYVDQSGVVQKGYPVGTTSGAGIAGFVIDGPVGSVTVNSQSVTVGNGAVNESGKIALYTLDGASIIETDQVVDSLTAGNGSNGKPVYAVSAGNGTAANIGKVTLTSGTASGGTNAVIGWVEGIRYLQRDTNYPFSAQTYTSVDSQGNSASASYSYRGQAQLPVLAIKLASTSVGNSQAAS